MLFQVNPRDVVEALEEAVDAGLVRTEPVRDPAAILLGQLRLWNERQHASLARNGDEDPERALEDAAA